MDRARRYWGSSVVTAVWSCSAALTIVGIGALRHANV